MKKRGAATIAPTLLIIFEIILVVMVAYMMFDKVNSIQKKGFFEKKFYARDIATVLDAMPKDDTRMILAYNPPFVLLSKFDYEFKPSTILVDDEQYHHAADITAKLKNPDTIWLASTDKQTASNKIIPEHRYNFKCGKTKAAIAGIILDPGHGWNQKLADEGATNPGDKGITSGSTYESELARQTALVLSSAAKQGGLGIKSTRGLENDTNTNMTQRIKLIKENPAFAVISIHYGPTSNNNIKAYINADSRYFTESQRIACEALNALSEKYEKELTGTALIAINTELLPPDDPRQVLLKDRTAVLFELGSIDAFSTRTAELAGAMAQGIERAQK